MENFDVFDEFCVQLMAHGEHICEYTHVYGFLNRKRYGLTVVADITEDGFFALFSFCGVVDKILVKEGSDLNTLKRTIARFVRKYNMTKWLAENLNEILKHIQKIKQTKNTKIR